MQVKSLELTTNKYRYSAVISAITPCRMLYRPTFL